MISYNGIAFEYPRTTTYEMVNSLDPSNSDRLFTTFKFGIESMLDSDQFDALNPGAELETAAEKAKRIEHLLLTPRRPFLYSKGEIALIAVDQDDANGPMPLSCSVRKVSDGGWQILWTCEVKLANCQDKDKPNDVLSLKFATTADYDSDWCGTRTTSGLLILSRRSMDPTLDNYRSKVSPELLPGYRRESSSYAVSEDGLKIRFTFRDKQLHRVPPRPATSIQGEEGLHSPNPGGITYQFINLKLGAPPGTNMERLANAAIAIVQSRVAGNRFNRPGTATRVVLDGGKTSVYLMDLRVVKGLGDKETSVTVSANWTVNTAPASSSNAASLGLSRVYTEWLRAELPGEDPERTIGPPLEGLGDFPIRLVAAALSDPCGEMATIDQPRTTELRNSDVLTGSTEDGGTFRAELRSSTSLEPESQSPIKYQTPGVYVWYECTSHNTRNEGNAVLPSTVPGQPGVLVQLHNPTHKVRCEFTAKRVGGKPEIPSPTQTSNSNLVLLKSTISPAARSVSADGQLVYEVSGIFDYEYLDASISQVDEPIPPFLSESVRATAGDAVALLDSDILFQPGAGENPWQAV